MKKTPKRSASLLVEGFAEDLASLAEELAEQWNSDHADTIALIAWFGSRTNKATQAEIVELRPDRLVLASKDAGEPTRTSIDFDQPALSVEDLRTSLMGLLEQARKHAGDQVPATAIEREIARTQTLPTHITRVRETRKVSPNIQEITLGGGLEEFVSIGPDQLVYVLAQKPGQKDIIGIDSTMTTLLAAPEDQRPLAAYYTIRHHRPESGELDLWFVLHDHPAGMSGWAARAIPGEPVALWGPRSSFESPPNAETLLLFGDETALPAISAILESSEIPARVVVETIDEGHKIELPTGPTSRSAGCSARTPRQTKARG